jgi:hypothetical protein
VGLTRVNAMLAQLGHQQTRINRTTGDLVRRIFVLAGPKYGTFTDRELYNLGSRRSRPPIVSIFVNRNQGSVLQVEEVIGRIAKDLVIAWGSRSE